MDRSDAARSDSQGRRLGRIVVEAAAIERRNDELAQAIRRELPDDEPVVLGLLNGSFVFLADLGRALSRCGVRPRIHFLQTSSYGSGRKPKPQVELIRGLDTEIRGRSVLIVDDVLDSGGTLAKVLKLVEDKGASWIKSCVLLDKPSEDPERVAADWVGFKVPATWVVGYGLDDDGAYRELPFVAELM